MCRDVVRSALFGHALDSMSSEAYRLCHGTKAGRSSQRKAARSIRERAERGAWAEPRGSACPERHLSARSGGDRKWGGRRPQCEHAEGARSGARLQGVRAVGALRMKPMHHALGDICSTACALRLVSRTARSNNANKHANLALTLSHEANPHARVESAWSVAGCGWSSGLSARRTTALRPPSQTRRTLAGPP